MSIIELDNKTNLFLKMSFDVRDRVIFKEDYTTCVEDVNGTKFWTTILGAAAISIIYYEPIEF